MRTLLSALALVLGPSLAAQTGAQPYVTPYVPLSAEAQAVAEAGAFGATADPLRMLDNPAVLADFAGGLSVTGDRIPNWFDLDGFSTTAVAVAGGIRTSVAGMPASVGVGVAYGSFDQPVLPLTDATGGPLGDFDAGRDETLALGIGGAIAGPLRVRAGASLRHYSSGAFVGAREGDERASALTADLGIDVTAPVGRWLMPTHDGGFQLVTDVSAGYALRGIALSETAPVIESEVFDYGPPSWTARRRPASACSSGSTRASGRTDRSAGPRSSF